MHNWDPSEVGAAKIMITEGLDKLRVARDRLSMQRNDFGPGRALALNQIIENIEHELERL